MFVNPITVPDQLLLRCLNSNDIGHRYLAWVWDPAVTGQLEVRFTPPSSLNDLRAFVKKTNESEDTLLLGIFLPEPSRHIGNIKLGPINFWHRTADIGLLIGDRDEWGKGWATMAIKAVTDFAFKELGLYKVTASCYSSNKGSWHAFLNAGFKEEGRRDFQYQMGDERVDSILLGRVNSKLASVAP